MIAAIALALHIPPKEVWTMDPKDLATIIDLMDD